MPENPNTEGSIQETGGIPVLQLTVSPSQNVQTPVDKTLSISEMAADAKATGDAINNLGGALEDEIANLAADVITKSMIDTSLTEEGMAADAAAVGVALAGKADASVENISVNGKTMDAQGAIHVYAEDIQISGQDATTVGEAITAANERIDEIESNTDNIVKTVNNIEPDETGNVDLTRVPYADNLLSSGSQNSRGTFLMRTTGGDASISDGTAQISSIHGNMVHTGYVAESIVPTVNGSFTISIDRDVFVSAVIGSGTYTFEYTTEWDPELSTYGITVDGEPEENDSISIEYVMEERGTITPSNIQTFVSTGWNLYSALDGYARVYNYSENYGFRVGGSYSIISFSETVDGAQTLLTVTDRNFHLPEDATEGYVFVTGADSTTEIYMTWSDWTTQGNGGNHQVYTQSVVNLSGIMTGSFPYGLLAVMDIRDEINFSNRKAYSRIEPMGYSAENMQVAQQSGRPFEYDENMIYLVRDTIIEIPLSEGMGQYTANDHGLEIITGATVAPTVNIIYSNDLKNKLERDVLTISQQTLTAAQKEQVQNNIGISNLQYKKVLTSSDDLNSISDGTYWFEATNRPSNSPATMNSIVEQITFANGNQIFQTVTTAENAITYVYKRRWFGTWGNWSGFALNSNTFSLANGSDIPNNTNFNTLTTVGNYRVRTYSSAATMTNIPQVAAGTLYVKNTMLEASAYRQQIYITIGNRIYIRDTENNGSSWNAWSSISGQTAAIGNTNGTTSFNIPNNYRGRLTTVDSNVNRCGEWIVYATAGGSITAKPIVEASLISITSTTNTLTITVTDSGIITIVFDNYTYIATKV